MRASSGITLSKCSQFQNETNLSHAKKKNPCKHFPINFEKYNQETSDAFTLGY